MTDFLILRLSSLGDIVHTLPAFSALRRNFPEAKIRWAVEQKGREILDLVPGIDEIIVIGRKKWLKIVKNLRRRDQIVLDFQGLVKSALLAFLSGSKRKIGFHRKNCKEPLASLFYSETPAPFPEEEEHVIAKNLRLLTRLGIREEVFDFPLVLPEEVRRSVESELQALGYRNDQKLILYNVGAAWETKRWFPERWAELIEKTRFSGSFPLLLWGNNEEQNLAQTVKEKTGVALTRFLSVKEVIGLVRAAFLLVSGDTFALQVACALAVPAIALFGPTNPRRNGPFRPTDRSVFTKLECNPCYQRTCPTLECLRAIAVEDVAVAISKVWVDHESSAD
ncbi:MAG: glycosyltransferase family 9 protein [Acidobacteriota bacterium]